MKPESNKKISQGRVDLEAVTTIFGGDDKISHGYVALEVGGNEIERGGGDELHGGGDKNEMELRRRDEEKKSQGRQGNSTDRRREGNEQCDLTRDGGFGSNAPSRHQGSLSSSLISNVSPGEPSYCVKPVSESVGVVCSASTNSEKMMELSLVEVGQLSGRLENLGEQLIQNTTVNLDAKNKESVTNVNEKLPNIDRALSVGYLDSNLNSSKSVAMSSKTKDTLCGDLNPSLPDRDIFSVGSISSGPNKSGYKLQQVGKSPKMSGSPVETIQTSGNTSGELVLPNPHNYKSSRDSVSKKATWKRMTREKNTNSKGDLSVGVEGKCRLSDSVEATNMDLEKKQKLEEESHTLDQVNQFEVAEKSDNDVLSLAVTIAWALWTRRNEKRHGRKFMTGLELVNWCGRYIDSFKAANSVASSPSAAPSSADSASFTSATLSTLVSATHCR
nr:hypothetical protein CFP56_67999 [Quercus suber]